jgi:hypothetical protein
MKKAQSKVTQNAPYMHLSVYANYASKGLKTQGSFMQFAPFSPKM